jgi:hypothetical protein
MRRKGTIRVALMQITRFVISFSINGIITERLSTKKSLLCSRMQVSIMTVIP